MKQSPKSCRRGVLLTVSAILIASHEAFGATTGFNQTAAGPWDYNASGNWVGGTINGLWDSSLTLSAAQTVTFAADTTLSTGLTFNYAGAFALTLDSSSTTARNLTLGGDISLNPASTSGNVTIGNASNPLNVALGTSRNITVTPSGNTLTIVNVISGTGFGLTKAGAGTLTLAGANTYTGPTVLSAGTLTLSGSISSSSPLVFNGNATLSYTHAASSSQSFAGATLSGYGSVGNATSGNTVGLGTITRNAGSILNVSSTTGNTTLGNSVDATGILGTWATVLTGTSLQYAAGGGGGAISAYSGATAATAGTLANVTSSSVNYSFGAAATQTAAITANTLRYTGAGAVWANGGFGVTLNGLMNAGTGSLTNNGTGIITIGANKELVIIGNTQGTTIGSVIADNGGGASSVVYGGPSAGALTLTNGASTFSGGATLTAGTLLLQASSTPTAAGSTVTSGPLGTGTLTLSGGTFGFFGGGFTIANSVNVVGAANIEVASGANEVLNGNWSGSGNLNLIANGSTGQWQLGGDNSGYTGTFTQNGGNTSLAFNSASAGSASAAWVFGNTTAQRTRLNFGAGTINFGSLAGNGSIANIAASGLSTMSVGPLNTSTTFSGIIGDGTGQAQNISLLKVGAGSLTLSGLSKYTSTTTVENGALTAGATVTNAAASPFGNAASAIALGDATTISSATAMNPQLLNGGAFTMGRTVTVGANNNALGNPSTAFTLGGSTANSSAFSGAITLNQSLVVTQAASGTLTISGGISSGGGSQTINFNNPGSVAMSTTAIANGSGTVTLTQSGAGTTTLSAANTFTGGVNLNAGVVNLNATETPGTSGPLGASGTITFGGGTLQYSLADSADYSARFATSASQPFKIDVNGQSVSFGTGLSSSGGSLTLSDTAGNGTLTLNANYSLSSIAVNAGRLAVTSTQGGAGTVTVSSGAKLKVTASGANQWSPASLTLNSGSTTLDFDNISSTSVAPLNPTSVANSGTATVNVNSGTFAVGSTYPLVANVSSTSGYSLAAGPLLTLGVAGHLVISGGALAMQVDSVADIWTGSVNGTWDINGTANWTGHATKYADGDNVLFDDTASGSTTVTVGAQVNPGSVTVNNSSKTYSITASGGNYIGGSGSLSKAGTGTLTLSGPNNYSGGTTISAGTLQLGAANSLPAAGSVTLGGSGTAGTLDLAGNNQQVGGLAVGSGATAASQTIGNSSTANNASLTVNSSGSSSFGGVIKDAVGSGTKNVALTVSGGGTLALSGANTFSGGTTISNGTLQVGAANALPVSGTVTLGGSGTAGTLDLAGNNQQVGGLAVGSGAIASSQIIGNSSTANNVTLTFNSSGASTFGGIIQNMVGAGNKTVGLAVASGTLTLSGANTFSGTTTVSSTLQLQNANAIQNSALTLNSGSTLSLQADADTTFASASLAGFIPGNTYDFQVNSLNTPAGNGHTLTLTGQTGASAAGTTTLNISSTTGDTMKFNTAYAIGGNSGGAWGGDTNAFSLNGANLILNGVSQANNNDCVISLASASGNSLTINGTVSVNGSRTIGAIVNTGMLTLNSTVTGPGGANWGLWVALNSGTLNLNNNGAINNNAAIGGPGNRVGFTIAGGNLDNTSGTNVTLTANPTIGISADFTFIGTTNLNLGTGSVTLQNATHVATVSSNTLTIGGVISGAFGLTKAGAGRLTLAGANTYTGDTVVSNNGTLLVNGSVAGTTMVKGGTLGGNGTIGGSVTVESAATLSPGTNGIGTLVVTGDITLNSGSTNTFSVNGTTSAYTAVAAGGAVNYGGLLNIVPSGIFTVGQQFQLFSGAGAANVSNFASIAGSPGSGLAFSFTNGVLSVVSAGPSGPATMTNSYNAGTQVFSLSWPAGQGWRLESQTNNISAGLNPNPSAWSTVSGYTDGSYSITTDPLKPTVFYRLVYP